MSKSTRYVLIMVVTGLIFSWGVVSIQDMTRVKEVPTTNLIRSDAEMKAFEQKLLAAHQGDLLVVVPYEGEQLPKLLQVNTLQQHDGIAVSYVTGHDTGSPGAFPLNSVSSFLNIHRSIGFVHIVPRERVKAFYRSIELTAADLSQ